MTRNTLPSYIIIVTSYERHNVSNDRQLNCLVNSMSSQFNIHGNIKSLFITVT